MAPAVKTGSTIPAGTTGLESRLAAGSLGERPVPTHVEAELREYLRCGILCFGFARGHAAPP